MNPLLTPANSPNDFDRGLELLNHHLHNQQGLSRPNIVQDLLDIDTHIEEKKHELEISKRRWDAARKISGGLTAASLLGELVTVCVDELLINNERDTIYWIKIAFLISIAVMAVFFAITTGIFQCIFGNRYEEQKSYMNEITPDEKAAIMKIKTVITSIGYLDKHKDNPNTPIDATVNKCFHCINDLPETPIKENAMPEKSDLVSVVIDLLPEEHPIKQKIKDISQHHEEEEEQMESTTALAHVAAQTPAGADHVDVAPHAFQDKGQRSFPLIAKGAVDEVRHTTERMKRHWTELTQMIGGTHVNALFAGGRTLPNPLRPNPYATIVDLSPDVEMD